MEQVNLEILETLFSRRPLRSQLDHESTAKLLIRFSNFMNMQCHEAGTDLAGIQQMVEKNLHCWSLWYWRYWRESWHPG